MCVCVCAAEGGHSDGDSHRDVLRLLAGRVLLHLLPGLPGQLPDHHAADPLLAGESPARVGGSIPGAAK